MPNKIIIAASHQRYRQLEALLSPLDIGDFRWISDRDELDFTDLVEYSPDVIFFLHWHWKVPVQIYKQFRCIMFHMTDLPYGRGGSPLQNLIIRKKTETMITAFLCDEQLDAGPVFLKKPLSLRGSAREIFDRAMPVVGDMIVEILAENPLAIPQQGKVTLFERRQPADGNIESLVSIEDVYDYIRMLDDENYPAAFAETGSLRFEFRDAELTDNAVFATVKITLKNVEEK